MEKDVFVKQCREKYGDKFNYALLPNKISRKIETIICDQHGKIKIIPRDHLRSKYGCNKCAVVNKRKDRDVIISEFLEKSRNKFNNKYEYKFAKPGKNVRDNLLVKCPTHGWHAASMRTHYNSITGCTKCGILKGSIANIQFQTYAEYITAANLVHKNEYVYLPSNFVNLDSVINIKCRLHGVFSTKAGEHLNRARKCRKCRYDKRSIGFDAFKKRANKIHDNAYIYYSNTYKTTNHPILLKHKLCGREFHQVVKKHLEGQGCKYCKSSLGEKLLREVFIKNKIEYNSQYRIMDYKYSFDFYLPKLNILIEYDGAQHFKPIKFWGGEERYKIQLARDKYKDSLANMHDIPLIRIPYTEYDNLENYLLYRLSKFYKYRHKNHFYKNITELSNGELIDNPMDHNKFLTYRSDNCNPIT